MSSEPIKSSPKGGVETSGVQVLGKNPEPTGFPAFMAGLAILWIAARLA